MSIRGLTRRRVWATGACLTLTVAGLGGAVSAAAPSSLASASATSVNVAPGAVAPDPADLRARFDGLEARVRKLEAQLGIAPPATSSPTVAPTAPSTTPSATPTRSPSATTPSSSPTALPQIPGAITLPSSGRPPNPGSLRVLSPNTSPVASADQLRGPRLRFACGDNPEQLNGQWLAAGSVVEFQRGCTWSNVRVVVKGAGTNEQPILLQSFGDAARSAPVFAASKQGRYKDDAVISLEGAHIHARDLAVKNSASIAFGVNGVANVLHNVEGANVVTGAWVRGQWSRVWNSYFHDLRMMPDTPGPNDDYGASGVVVEANDITVEGLTCRNCIGDSPDYNKYGGDGAFAEVWMKGDNLKIRYGYADRTPRLLEAGGLGRQSARNMVVANLYAKGISDSPFYFNPVGDYSGIDTSGFREYDNVIVK